jgi:hypothetical protein
MSQEPETRLSDDLSALLHEGRSLTLREIEARLKGRGFALLIMLLSAPFLVPLPGLSTPFGFAIAIMGLRIAVGQDPWLPDYVLRRELSPKVLKIMVGVLLKISEIMERVIKPRMHFLRTWPGAMNMIGVGIFVSGVILLLPLPIPFSNTLPALSIVLLSAGMMERDGLAVLAGYVVGMVGVIGLVVLSILGKAGVDWLWARLPGLFAG